MYESIKYSNYVDLFKYYTFIILKQAFTWSISINVVLLLHYTQFITSVTSYFTDYIASKPIMLILIFLSSIRLK